VIMKTTNGMAAAIVRIMASPGALMLNPCRTQNMGQVLGNLAAAKEGESSPPVRSWLDLLPMGLQPTDMIRRHPRPRAPETKTGLRGSSRRKTTSNGFLRVLASRVSAIVICPGS
jgi:hypothetical protein